MVKNIRMVGLAALFLLMAAFSSAQINVTTTSDNVTAGDGDCSLREAINNANNNGDVTSGDCTAGGGSPDMIVLGAGTYALSSNVTGEDSNARGDLDILDDLTLVGDTAATTTISGGSFDRVFHIDPFGTGVDVLFTKFTVQSGNTWVTGADGGGMYIESTGKAEIFDTVFRLNAATDGAAIFNAGTLLGSNNTFTNNQGLPGDSDGGAIYNSGTMDLGGSTFTNNSAQDDGGAIFSSGVFTTLDNSTLSGNTAGGSGGAIWVNGGFTFGALDINDNEANLGGGGIHATGAGSLNGSTVSQNTSYSDGGGMLQGGGGLPQLDLIGTTFTGNTATGNGGGLAKEGDGTFRFSTFSNNLSSTGHGGGLYLFGSGLINFDRCTVSGNQAAQEGGGIYQNGPSLIGLNSTVSGNTGLGGGIRSAGSSFLSLTHLTITGNNSTGLMTSGSPTLRGNLISGNTGGECSLGAAPTSGGYNLSGDNSCQLSGTGDIINTPVNLGPLANNGGSTLTHMPLLPNPAVDNGGTTCPVSTDQRNVSRPLDGNGLGLGARCDIGAVESPTLSPSTPPRVGDGIVGNPMGATKVDTNGTSLTVTWDVASCTSQDFALYSGNLADLGSGYAIERTSCDIGTTGSTTWNLGNDENIWFLIVANDNNLREGDWGQDSDSTSRNGATPSDECSLTNRVNTLTCP